MQNTTDRNKKRMGALLSALFMGGLTLMIAVCMLVGYFGAGESAWEATIILICAAIYLAIAGGVFIALRQRWQEIERGEEDEARKY